ncbi:nuclear transport factor 2 family protein [Rhodococcus sp. IEGM 1408]|uniref:nuclear transport factor 2 family protein n=1 Tax=Rhodococcus sp. IEGM 1408 TaxID=3082220 RepID=UPI002953F304|nr:nuclear transport factor 2 family protein [Rhodococcus sp. IEGM 1408]MDV7999716.1 nuclear transport factor 2 family protein [Rhodococcus sp. IEGM 1408]
MSDTGAAGVGGAEDLDAIRAVFARRLYVMDTKQWDSYGPCHTEDMVSESWAASGGAAEVRGREQLTAAIRATLDGRVPVTSVHHGHTPLLELTGPHPVTGEPTATGIWAMEDRLWWAADGRERWLHGWGHYHERYRRVDGEWLISYRRLERIRVDTGLTDTGTADA